MRTSGKVAVIVATLVLAAGAAVSAQVRWGRGNQPRAGACFYQDANFRGEYFCVRQGETVNSIPGGMNDRISSIRILGNADVMVFRDERFRGGSARFYTDVRNLKAEGWNDRISSVRVTGSSWGPSRPPEWGNDQMPREGACFYAESNFRGRHFCVRRGGSFPALPSGFGDRISSIRMQRAAVMIFRDRDYGGRSRRLGSSEGNLRGAWNDTISSLRVF
jgi:hypothetical protein